MKTLKEQNEKLVEENENLLAALWGKNEELQGKNKELDGCRRLCDELTSRLYGSSSLREQERFLRSKQEELEKCRAMLAEGAELGASASRRLKTLIEAWGDASRTGNVRGIASSLETQFEGILRRTKRAD